MDEVIDLDGSPEAIPAYPWTFEAVPIARSVAHVSFRDLRCQRNFLRQFGCVNAKRVLQHFTCWSKKNTGC